MSPEQIEAAIGQISWGGRYVAARDCTGETRFFIIKSPTPQDNNFIEFIYDSSYAQAKELGLMTKMELYDIYKRTGVWSQDDDIAIETLDTKIADLEKVIEQSPKKIQGPMRKHLDAMLDKRANLRKVRAEIFSYSVESYADEKRSMAMLFCCVYDELGARMWLKWNEFMSEDDNVLILNLFYAINSAMKVHSVKDIREIARSGNWRFRWGAGKNIGDLFDCSVSRFTPEQQSLVYWSQVYDSVYESMERPPDSVIDDDDALDKWFETQSKKQRQKDIERDGEIGGMKMSSKMRGHGEVFVVVNKGINPNAPEPDEVNSLNSEFIRKFKQKEEKKIKEAGVINEKNLRDRKDKIARKVIGASDAIVSGGAFGQGKGGKSAKTVLPGGTIS